MLIQAFKRTFSNQVYSWGLNLRTLGLHPKKTDSTSLPMCLNPISDGKLTKVINGYSDNLIIDEKGNIFHQGTEHILAENPIFKKLEIFDTKSTIIDADCDKNGLVFLTNQGEVFQTNQKKQVHKVDLPISAQFVAIGSFITLAVGLDSTGHQLVYVWGKVNRPSESAIFNTIGLFETQPKNLKAVSNMLQEKHTTVKKIRLVNNSAVILTESGEIISWGNNQKANLGVPRPYLSKTDDFVYSPSDVLKLNDLHEKVVDFALSDNILIILTKSGRAYFSGLDNVLKLTEIRFFEGQKIIAIGTNFNHYYVQSETGIWYSNKPFENQELIKYYGDLEIYQIEAKFFKKQQIKSIGGKYSNAFAF